MASLRRFSSSSSVFHKVLVFIHIRLINPICAGFFGGRAVFQTGISVWAAFIGMPPTASALCCHGIIVGVTHEQGVKSVKEKKRKKKKRKRKKERKKKIRKYMHALLKDIE